MPVRKTKRGAERTPLAGDWDAIGAEMVALARAAKTDGDRLVLTYLRRFFDELRASDGAGLEDLFFQLTATPDHAAAA